ncbi:hypothetical protein IAQ61_003102 [Plenodomus lingam]|uniref:CST complex subunit Ten1 n=1 Tax=Leptosphaeria maculans (strain JN3 / isolate v23.1.3 / race Av1-4-5-6-7-8) TaxID=985895 RepID=E5ADJ2_LEPMJ|nr:hypothetical protein LEMA_P000680.1 [Plenodomus lingam JN3]KAH9875638.1 hypothetical protein IAQ61_003102 [Plenodomus lingam]CBY01281.1 hypothetical protein LEMA_P000680.1 [Plenodomus lingam JN3]
MSGPVPSHLVLLADLEKCAPGTKVRFLGCIDDYIVKTAILRLKHGYSPSSRNKVVNVNIEHLLETVKHNEVDVGTWINVLGYVERRQETGIFVQAIAVWDAGNINLNAYVEAVQQRKATA